MRRREFVAGLGAATWPVVVRAQQQPERVRGIGVLTNMVCLIPNISQSLTYMLESDLYVSITRTLKVTIHHKQFSTMP